MRKTMNSRVKRRRVREAAGRDEKTVIHLVQDEDEYRADNKLGRAKIEAKEEIVRMMYHAKDELNRAKVEAKAEPPAAELYRAEGELLAGRMQYLHEIDKMLYLILNQDEIEAKLKAVIEAGDKVDEETSEQTKLLRLLHKMPDKFDAGNKDECEAGADKFEAGNKDECEAGNKDKFEAGADKFEAGNKDKCEAGNKDKREAGADKFEACDKDKCEAGDKAADNDKFEAGADKFEADNKDKCEAGNKECEAGDEAGDKAAADKIEAGDEDKNEAGDKAAKDRFKAGDEGDDLFDWLRGQEKFEADDKDKFEVFTKSKRLQGLQDEPLLQGEPPIKMYLHPKYGPVAGQRYAHGVKYRKPPTFEETIDVDRLPPASVAPARKGFFVKLARKEVNLDVLDLE